jgi:hypothetical protein
MRSRRRYGRIAVPSSSSRKCKPLALPGHAATPKAMRSTIVARRRGNRHPRGVSYVHCPTCACAYNLARDAACPRCVAAPETSPPAPLSSAAELVLAATQFARALARSTAADRHAARASLRLVKDQVAATIAPPSFTRLPRLLAAAATVLFARLA